MISRSNHFLSFSYYSLSILTPSEAPPFSIMRSCKHQALALCAVAAAGAGSVMVEAATSSSAPPLLPLHSASSTSTFPALHSSIINLRGGGSTPSKSKSKISGSKSKSSTSSGTKKKKKSGKKSSSSSSKSEEESKAQVNEKLSSSDPAKVLGDAIRERADILRSDVDDPFLQGIEYSLQSVSHGLGSSDARMTHSGGVEAPSSSIITSYFLNSHGGVHAIQSLLSLFSTIAGIVTLQVWKTQPELAASLLNKCLLCAMLKHVAGLVAAAFLASRAIPTIGLSQARHLLLTQVVLDPVAQYVAYSALVLLWLSTSQVQTYHQLWWSKRIPFAPLILTGPILLREVISNLLTVSDILVLLSTSKSNEESSILPLILNISHSIVDGIMSVLVSPSKWRPANPAQRQAILAKLVGKCSLLLEVLVGIILTLDGCKTWTLFVYSKKHRPKWTIVVRTFLIVRLYQHLLLVVRQKKVSKLFTELRGGAAQWPFALMDMALDPAARIWDKSENDQDPSKPQDNWTWNDYVSVGLGFS